MEHKFYIEDIFNMVEMRNKAIGIEFKATSLDYEKYPDGITLNKIDNIKLEVMLNNINKEVVSSGYIIGKGYNNTPPISSGEIALTFNSINVDEISNG
ncbi:MAG: hypothetical protein SNG57_02900 [Rikenellaceae bacterium]